MLPELTTVPSPPEMSTPLDEVEMTASKALVTVPPADRPMPVDAFRIWPKLFTVVGLLAPATPTPVALIMPVLRLVTVPPNPRSMASLKPLVLLIVPALSTVEGPPLTEPPLSLIERPVKPPAIVPPIELMTFAPPPSSAPLKPAVTDPEFIRVNVTSPVIASPVAMMAPWLVNAQPGLVTEATPVPPDVIVAPPTTIALVTPG